MFLDNYSGNHSFTTNKIEIDGSGRGIHFRGIQYKNEENPFLKQRNPEELFIQFDRILGKRLNILLSGYNDGKDLVGKDINLIASNSNFSFSINGKLIGIISNSTDWYNTLIDQQWERNDDQGYSDEEQAIFFGTTPEEIENRFSIRKKEKRLAKPKQSVFPIKEINEQIISYGVAISSEFIIGPANNNNDYRFYGQEVRSQKSSDLSYDSTLFPLIKEKKVRDLCNELADNNNILEIRPESSYSFISEGTILQNEESENRSKYIWLKFENFGENNDLLEFDAYYYAVSYNRDAFQKFVIPYESFFLRQIIYLSSLSTNLLIEEKKKQQEKERKQALKSAVSAIMCRNMSHNLGSHCIQYTNSDLLDLAKHSINNGSNLRGVGSLLSYIQGRMDYLAMAVSGDTPSLGSVDFISCIYNKLVNDSVLIRNYYGNFNNVESTNDSKRFKSLKDNQNLSKVLISLNNSINNEGNGRNISEVNLNYKAVLSEIEKIESSLYENKQSINYLLENLVKSEHFVRNPSEDKKKIDIQLRINNKDIHPGETNFPEVNIAMPGSILSIHAFFIIIENLIRNAAKHAPMPNPHNLIETINISYDENSQNATFIIHDNKHNSAEVRPLLRERLQNLRILSDNQQVDKQNKGLKEILIAVLWLRAIENKKNFQDILYEIETVKTNKIELIQQYGFSIVDVDDAGKEFLDTNGNKRANLGIKFVLPFYKVYCEVNTKDSDGKFNSLNSDIVRCADNKIYKSIKGKVPHAIYADKIVPDNETINDSVLQQCDLKNEFYVGSLLLDKIIRERYNVQPEKVSIIFGTNGYTAKEKQDKETIYFKRHLSEDPAALTSSRNYLYTDSVSGNNYTFSLQQRFLSGIRNGIFNKWSDKYLSLKIIESALTRITIIDERFFGVYSDEELKLKNIRILDCKADITKTTNLEEVFIGSDFKDRKNGTMFLSIHLGIIEKLLNNPQSWFEKGHKGYNMNHNCDITKIEYLIFLLKTHFGQSESPLFISIHSGRGNYSHEMEKYFSGYPFITLSALWDAFSDSKYQLAQLFLNSVYNGD